MPNTDPRTTEQKGLGHQHRRERREALAALVEGALCPLCGQPMWRSQALDYDHLVPRALGGTLGPKRLAHARCNRAEGGRLGNRRMRERAAAEPPPAPGTVCERPGGGFERWSDQYGWVRVSRRW
jgi:5-methylcytosine-specific restriction endonuclease McrA